MDDGYWPAFSTTRARSTNAQWEHVGEGFIKELDFGRVWLRLNENEEGDKDDVIAEFKCDSRRFLEQTIVGFVCSLLGWNLTPYYRMGLRASLSRTKKAERRLLSKLRHDISPSTSF